MGTAASTTTTTTKPATPLTSFALRHCDLHLASGGEREDWEADERKKRHKHATTARDSSSSFHGIVPTAHYVALEDEAETDGARASRAAAEAWAAEALLRRDASLTRLDLKHGRVSDRVVVALVAALERYGNALTDLDLRGGLAAGPRGNQPGVLTKLSSSAKSKSIRLIFGRFDYSPRALEARPKSRSRRV